jgi:NAD(P)-dependent dehydrogenase (short-subunit alcohol dehydrogenase family)
MSNPITADAPANALVIGAGGALGSLVSDAFRRRGWTVHDAGRTPITSPSFRYVDLAAPETLPAALQGVDLVVSTVPDQTLTAERHVLANGGLMLNLSAEPATALTTLRAAGEPTGTVVMNAGIAPGVTNLVAAALLEAHPDADEVELVFTVTTKGSGGDAAADFAHRGLTCVAHHRVSALRLAPPFGTRRVLGFAELDGGWLGPVAGAVTVSPYLCLAERPVQAVMLTLNRARLLPLLPRAAFGSRRPATVEGASKEPVAHHITVRRAGRRLETRIVKGNGDFRMAADSSAIFADALLGRDGGRAVGPGAWYPEEVLTLHRLGTPLAQAGIAVQASDHEGQPSW